MGLDVTHSVLVHQLVNKTDYWMIEDWDTFCNVPLEVYAPYITDVQTYEFNHDIAFVQNNAEAAALEKAAAAGSYQKIFVGLPNDRMAAEIKAYIAQHKLDAMERVDFFEEHSGLNYYTVSFGEPVTKKGFYYQDIGYQRKGMNNTFYFIFCQYDLWGHREDFEAAYDCIGSPWYVKHWGVAQIAEMQRKFKTDFLGRFEFGRSLLSASF